MSEEATATQEPAVSKPFDGGEVLGDPSALAARFGQKSSYTPNPLAKKTLPSAPVVPETTENPETPPAETTEISPPVEKNKQKNFVTTTLEENKTLKAQTEELSKKLAKYEKEDVPSLNQKIQELEQKAEGSDSKKETERLQKEIESIQGIISQKDTELSEKNKRLQLLDLPNDPDFKQKYQAPLNDAYTRTARILGANKVHQTELQKAFIAVGAAHKSQDPAEQERQMSFAIETVNGIVEQLSPAQQNQFLAGFWDTVGKSEEYSKAILNHEQTARQIHEARFHNEQEQKIRGKQLWGGAYKDNFQKVSEDVKYSEDVARIIAANKIDDITAEDEAIAIASFDPDAPQYPPESLTRIVAQGAQHRKLLASNKALRIMVDELNDTIGKFRGSSTAGSSASPVAEVKKEEGPKDPKTFEQMMREKLAAAR